MTFAAIVTAETLDDYLEPISAIVDECKINITPEGLRVTAVDPANVAMVDTRLHAEAFESYDADGGQIGIDLGRFEDVLALADDDDLVHLQLDEETRKLTIEYGEVDYTQALIDVDSIRQEPDLPTLDAPVTVTIEASKIERGVTAADLCSDHLEVGSLRPEALVFSAQGDTDDVDVTFEDDSLIDATITDAVRSLYALDYTKEIVGAMPSDAEVQVELDDEMPAKFSYYHADGHAPVTFMLSPRVATDGGREE